ncbi:MAG: hypothetical protein HY805_01430 [Nitrospirae bacterium]|nr:hypothetical protein [Nitrospirota bacterium]
MERGETYGRESEFDFGLERFKDEYNEVRPHESIGQRPPASVYEPSSRRYPEKILPPEYDEEVEVRRVKQSGEIMFDGKNYYLTELLAGERVGLVETDEACHEIRFGFQQYQIGGYQVCEKWLKDRKGKSLSLEALKHYCRIVTAIQKTISLQSEIDRSYQQVEKGIIEIR